MSELTAAAPPRFSDEQLAEAERLTLPFIPKILPAGWERVGGNFWLHRDGLAVCLTVQMHDGKRWLHTSCSRPKRMPSYDDLQRVKDTFIGPGRKAIMVIPAKEEHFNFMPFCLHLYSCLDGDLLPDFRIGKQL